MTHIGPRLSNFQAHFLIHRNQMLGLHGLHTQSIRTQKKPVPSLHENSLKTVSFTLLSRLNNHSPLMFLNSVDFQVLIIIIITSVIRTTIYQAYTMCQVIFFFYYKKPELHNYLHSMNAQRKCSMNSLAQNVFPVSCKARILM